MSTFDTAFALVINEEGGYINDPRDPGGETKFGISKRAYPQLDIASLTVDDAKAIYLKDYWNAAQCDRLPESVAVTLFDSAVNQGVVAATKLLQKALGVVPDGMLGNLSIAAANALLADTLLADFLAERALHYVSLPTFPTYGRGWMRRLFHVARAA